MNLGEQDRREASLNFQRRCSRKVTGQQFGDVLKSDLLEAVGVVDEYFGEADPGELEDMVEANFSQSLKIIRGKCATGLKIMQKAMLFQCVIDQRKIRDEREAREAEAKVQAKIDEPLVA